MTIKEAISAKLSTNMAISHLDISDSTGKHINHANFDGGFHLNAVIVSNDFENLAILHRHQLVYKALGSMIKNEIHAFSMKTFTVDEWDSNVA
ncbi:MAG: BolA family transcriptional regulator [Candidatus Marinimicrobia bacterium]|nr:BolA family transcriptional regulator [Candidatus Neomarinimicrobiota bacterium]